MGTKILVNLPVKDLPKSKEFFSRIGFSFKEKFIDDTADCIVVSDDMPGRRLTPGKFKEYSPKRTPDTVRPTEVRAAISCRHPNRGSNPTNHATRVAP